MQTIKDFKDFIQSLPANAVTSVTFGKCIDEKVSYAEEGMRANIVFITDADEHGVLQMKFDFSPFDAYNTPLESSDYFDSNQEPVLTAKQAGQYSPQELMYFDLDEPVADLLSIEHDSGMKLFLHFKEEQSPLSYVQWLESKILCGSQPTV